MHRQPAAQRDARLKYKHRYTHRSLGAIDLNLHVCSRGVYMHAALTRSEGDVKFSSMYSYRVYDCVYLAPLFYSWRRSGIINPPLFPLEAGVVAHEFFVCRFIQMLARSLSRCGICSVSHRQEGACALDCFTGVSEWRILHSGK